MSKYSRRQLLRDAGLAVLVSSQLDAQQGQQVHALAAKDAKAAGGVYKPKKFNAQEYATLERLTDLIIPSEGTRPGAKAAGAAAWIDLMVSENATLLNTYSSGIAWLNHTMITRTGKDFVNSSPVEQTAFLDIIAFRRNTTPQLTVGIQFFDWVRRMTLDAYYTSKIGITDLGYKGNAVLQKFEVPIEAIEYALKRSGYA